MLYVGGCVGVSAVVSFGFVVGAGGTILKTGYGLGLNEFAVGTGDRAGLGHVVGASLINTYPVWEDVDDEAIIDHA